MGHYPDIYSFIPLLQQVFDEPIDDSDDETLDIFESDPNYIATLPSEIQTYMKQYRMLSKSSLVGQDKDLECGICFEIPLFPFTTKCNHMFCIDCIKKYLFRKTPKDNCPTCRSPDVSFLTLDLESEKMKKWLNSEIECECCSQKVLYQIYREHIIKCNKVYGVNSN